jgi:hypothetical protein
LGGFMGLDEYPPLLGPGLHKMSAAELKKRVVDAFPLSQSRPTLWVNFLDLLNTLHKLKIPCEIWVDGSFLTEKIEPADVDFVADIPVEILHTGSPAQGALIKKLADHGFKNPEKLHSFVIFKVPPGDTDFAAMKAARDQWQKDFGLSYVKKDPKGIAVLEVRP